jgi:hypothetical protein
MGLYEDHIEGSVQISTVNKSWKYIVVQWNDSRITNIAFVGSGSESALSTAGASETVQVLRRPENGTLWVTMEVFVPLRKRPIEIHTCTGPFHFSVRLLQETSQAHILENACRFTMGKPLRRAPNTYGERFW